MVDDNWMWFKIGVILQVLSKVEKKTWKEKSYGFFLTFTATLTPNLTLTLNLNLILTLNPNPNPKIP